MYGLELCEIRQHEICKVILARGGCTNEIRCQILKNIVKAKEAQLEQLKELKAQVMLAKKGQLLKEGKTPTQPHPEGVDRDIDAASICDQIFIGWDMSVIWDHRVYLIWAVVFAVRVISAMRLVNAVL